MPGGTDKPKSLREIFPTPPQGAWNSCHFKDAVVGWFEACEVRLPSLNPAASRGVRSYNLRPVNAILLGILFYVILQLAIGLAVSRGVRSEDDYLVAGRSLGVGLATLSFFATWFGAETCISSAGGMYERGLSGGAAEPFGYGLCIVFLGLVFAVPLWKRGLTTLADLFRLRYSPGVERCAVALLVPTSIFWAAAQINALGHVVSAASEGAVGVSTAIFIAAVVVILYTTSGGLRADVITDAIQGVLIIVGLGVLLWAVLKDLGGVSAAWAVVPAERRNVFPATEGSLWDAVEAWMIPICGSVVAQELVARIAASRTAHVARTSAVVGGSLYMLVGLIPAFIGLVGLHYHASLDDPEQILPMLAREHLPTLLYILFAGALVSAILSTVDSSLLAAAALASHNLLVPLFRVTRDSNKLKLARYCVVAGGVAAFVLALRADNISDLVEMSSAFGGAGLFTIMVMGLFSRFGGASSAYAAMGCSVCVWLLGTSFMKFDHPFLWSMIAAWSAYLLVAFLSRARATA